MKALLTEINNAVDDVGGQLSAIESKQWREKYRTLLKTADIECPPPDESERKEGKPGKIKRSKAQIFWKDCESSNNMCCVLWMLSGCHSPIIRVRTICA
jgi:hypothetical protein